MNCCNDYGQCSQGANCPARAPFTFCRKDIPPHKELASDAFYLIGFVLFVAVICLIAGVSWGLFERFYPSTACMVQMIFSINCK